MDEVTHTILPNTAGGGWGGTALGAGFGGLIGSWLGNGGFGGFGGNRAGIGYDTGALNGIQGQLNNISGQTWKLIKSANSGMCEIPDPRNLNIIDCWNHEHPASSGKVFLYVVEGVRIPKTSREQACKILYCWFSQVNNKAFTPQMIKANEWLLANVYASEITDARVGKLKAICKYEEKKPTCSDGSAVSSRTADTIN